MPRSRKGPRDRNAGGLWVSADLALKLKGPQGSRGVRLPQSPYLDLADKFLGKAHASAAPPIREPVDEDIATPALGRTKRKQISFPRLPPLVSRPKPPRLTLPKPNPPKRPKLNVPKLRRRES
jgi:hypothetical protein